jgi:hypothetical protein
MVMAGKFSGVLDYSNSARNQKSSSHGCTDEVLRRFG